MIWLWVVLGFIVLAGVIGWLSDSKHVYDGSGQRILVETIGVHGIKTWWTTYSWELVEHHFPLADERNQWYVTNPYYVAWKYDQEIR